MSGRNSPSTRAGPGIPSRGNMKPDSSTFGSRIMNEICMAWACVRAIVLKGVGLAALWPQALALAGFAVAFFSFSSMRFHKQLE